MSEIAKLMSVKQMEGPPSMGLGMMNRFKLAPLKIDTPVAQETVPNSSQTSSTSSSPLSSSASRHGGSDNQKSQEKSSTTVLPTKHFELKSLLQPLQFEFADEDTLRNKSLLSILKRTFKVSGMHIEANIFNLDSVSILFV